MCWREERRTRVTVPGLGTQLCVPAWVLLSAHILLLWLPSCWVHQEFLALVVYSCFYQMGTPCREWRSLDYFEESSGVRQGEMFCFVEDVINAFRQPEERSLSGLLEWWIQPVQTQLLSRAPRGCRRHQSLLATGAVLLAAPCHRASSSQQGGSSQPLPGLCVMDIPPNPEVTLPAAH